MKHLRTLNDYLSNINEGINFNGARDAELEDIGAYILTGDAPDEHNDEENKKAALETLKKAKPFPLSGKIKEDLPKLVKYIKDAFGRAGVSLDDSNVEISKSMSGESNEILIPLEDQEDYFIYTSLDYFELVTQGDGITLFAAFYSDDEGMLDFNVANLDNQGNVVKACADFKKYLENTEK